MHLSKFLIPEVIFGTGTLDQVGTSLLRLGARRVFLATDPGVCTAGWVDRITPYLEDSGLDWITWDGVTENPKDVEVADGADVYLTEGCDAILAIGGGSPIDAAKAVGIVVTNGGAITDYEGIDRIERPLPPMVMVPSTGGTGADVSQFAIITDTQRRVKLVICSKSLVPDVSITDPTLLTTKDELLTAYTGMDALTHAVESYVSVASTPLTDVHALSAIELVSRNLRASVASQDNIGAKSGMAMASLEGGISLSNASLGATHALTHQVGGMFDVPHGRANAVVLPLVMECNLISDIERYARIAAAMGESVEGLSSRDAALLSIRAVRNLAEDIGIPNSLPEVGEISRQCLEALVASCRDDVCMVTNPRDLSVDQIRNLFSAFIPLHEKLEDGFVIS